MNSFLRQWLVPCLRSGTAASLLSGAVIAWCARRDSADAAAGLNAPSHWVWGDEALGERGVSRRYTGIGMGVHHVSSLFWASIYAGLLAARPRTAAAPIAAGVAAVAAWVDLRLVPHRLTPGFQLLLTRRSLAAVYAAFGLGLWVGSARVRRLP